MKLELNKGRTNNQNQKPNAQNEQENAPREFYKQTQNEQTNQEYAKKNIGCFVI